MAQLSEKFSAVVGDALQKANCEEMLFEAYVGGLIKPGDDKEGIAAKLGIAPSMLTFERYEAPEEKIIFEHYRNYMSRSFADTNLRFRPNAVMPGLTKRTESYVIGRFTLFIEVLNYQPLPFESSEPHFLGDETAYRKLTASLLSAVVDGKLKKGTVVKLARNYLYIFKLSSEMEALFALRGGKLELLNDDTTSRDFITAFFSCLKFQNTGNKSLFMQKLNSYFSTRSALS